MAVNKREIREELYPIGVNLTEIYIDGKEEFYFQKAFYYDFDKMPHELFLSADERCAVLYFPSESNLPGCPCHFFVNPDEIVIQDSAIYDQAYFTPFLFHNVGKVALKVRIWAGDEYWDIKPGESRLVEPKYLEYKIGRHESWPSFRKKDFKRFFAHRDFYLQDANVLICAVNEHVPLHIGELRKSDVRAFAERLEHTRENEAFLYLYIAERKGFIIRRGCERLWLTDEENSLMYEAMNEFIKDYLKMDVTFDEYIQLIKKNNKKSEK